MEIAFEYDSAMHPNTLQVESIAHSARSIGVALLLAIALAGCAAGLKSTPDKSPSEDAPYVGVFTGDYVDGKPLYRFPAIHVVGSRSSVDGI